MKLTSETREKRGKMEISISTETLNQILGHDAEPHSWPWIVQLKYGHNVQNSRSGHSCSGTIVHENLIISAAHCCQAYRNMDLLLGIVAEHRYGIFKRLESFGINLIFMEFLKFLR